MSIGVSNEQIKTISNSIWAEMSNSVSANEKSKTRSIRESKLITLDKVAGFQRLVEVER